MTHAARPLAYVHRLRVYWEDTDAGGVVFYANHLIGIGCVDAGTFAPRRIPKPIAEAAQPAPTP
jgi:acyl-CoA thioesterase FadM